MLPNFVATAMGFQWITWISLCGTNFSCQAMNTFQTIIQTNSRQCITLYNSWEIFCVINKRVKIFSILFIFYVEHDRSTNTAFGLNGLSPKSQHTWQQKIPTHMAAGGKIWGNSSLISKIALEPQEIPDSQKRMLLKQVVGVLWQGA